jgi:hypothetical protein
MSEVSSWSSIQRRCCAISAGPVGRAVIESNVGVTVPVLERIVARIECFVMRAEGRLRSFVGKPVTGPSSDRAHRSGDAYHPTSSAQSRSSLLLPWNARVRDVTVRPSSTLKRVAFCMALHWS